MFELRQEAKILEGYFLPDNTFVNEIKNNNFIQNKKAKGKKKKLHSISGLSYLY